MVENPLSGLIDVLAGIIADLRGTTVEDERSTAAKFVYIAIAIVALVASFKVYKMFK